VRLPTTLELVVFAVGAAAIVGGGAYVLHLKHQADKYQTAIVQRDQARRDLEDMVASTQRVNDLSEAYLHELQTLRVRPVSTEPVRLCKPVVRAPVAPTDPAGRDDPRGPTRHAASGDGADNSEGAGPDIRPDLNAYAEKRAQRDAQTRLLQGYVLELRKLCGT